MEDNIAYDIDPVETREWLEAFNMVVVQDGTTRAQFLLRQLLDVAHKHHINFNSSITTPYCNTIKPNEEPLIQSDEYMNQRIRALIRWNAVAMVLRSGKHAVELGGHIASYASAATLYEVGFNYFFK